jgi:hypothetical protein
VARLDEAAKAADEVEEDEENPSAGPLALAIDLGEAADAAAGVAETAGTRGGAPTPEASGAG